VIVYRISTGVPVQIEPARQPDRVFLRGMNGEVTDLSSRACTRRPRRSSSGHAPECHAPDAQQPLLPTADAPPLQNAALGDCSNKYDIVAGSRNAVNTS